jgi:PTS system maltose and glucose-specific IIC component
MKEKVMNGLEKFSKAMLSPLSYISAAGLILVLGALLTSTSLSAMIPVLQWTPIKLLGQLIYNCIMVIINNLSLMFCVGIAAALAKKNKQQAAIIGLMSYFMYLTAGNVTLTQLGMLAEADPMVGLYGTGQSTVFGIQTVDMGVFGGILLGLVCGWVYNRTCEKQFKGIITQIYSGNRWSFTCMVVFSILFGFGSCFFWPPVQNVISALTDLIATSGNFGLFLYGFLERFLIPTGLHHLIYTPFQFSALGNSLTVGDATYTGSYIVMMMEYSMGLPFSDGIVWMYTGFTKTFGYLGIAAAFIFTARRENRARTAAAMIPLAVTASVASITEPIDFLFCFVSPLLWVAHAVITGGFMVLLHVLHVRAFTSNLLGSLVFNLSAGEQLQNMPLLYLLGFAEILTYFAVFSILIKVKNLPTPGREAALSADQSPYADPQEVCRFIAALGGPENIAQLGNCFTRLRLTVRDASLLDMGALLSLPHKGLVVQGTRVQLVCGLHAAQLRHALEQQLAEMAPV